MNYIYDITLNLNKIPYDFYEWKEDDNLKFILKAPIYKIDYKCFLDLKNNDVIISKKVLDTIKNKTEVYNSRGMDIIKYLAIFLSDYGVIAIEFDNEGNNMFKSFLSMDEENEVMMSFSNMKYTLVDYKIRKKIKNTKKFITRERYSLTKKISKQIENMFKNKENSKLKYIFYELYDEKNNDVEKIYSKLMNIAKMENDKFDKLCSLITTIENKKIMSNNS